MGANFAPYWLARFTAGPEPVVNLEKLTYTGNLETQALCVAMRVQDPNYYAPWLERCIAWDDPSIGI